MVEHQPRLLGSWVRFPAGAFAIFSVSAKASLPISLSLFPFLLLSLPLTHKVVLFAWLFYEIFFLTSCDKMDRQIMIFEKSFQKTQSEVQFIQKIGHLNKLNFTFASFGKISQRSCTWSQKGPSTFWNNDLFCTTLRLCQKQHDTCRSAHGVN